MLRAHVQTRPCRFRRPAFCCCRPRPSADVTAFLGTNPTPSNRVVKGFSGGIGLVIVGFEFEYARTREDLDELAPSLRTYMFNGLLQTPVPIAGMQFYAHRRRRRLPRDARRRVRDARRRSTSGAG